MPHASVAAAFAGLLTLLLATGCQTAAPPTGMKVRLGGAQIAVELVESWLGESRSPEFGVVKVSPVYLTQHGFENLASGECDVACTDRPLTERERQRLFPADPGDPGAAKPRRITGRRIAFYGYALYVNTQNPLDSIFSKHMKMVFEGRVKDWSELAGPQIPDLTGPIKLYGPPKGSRGGQILGPIARIWFADATWTELEPDTAIVQAVAADPLAMGFASIGYDGAGTRYMGLRLERLSAPAFPSIEEIEAERYGLAKVIYVYHDDPPTPAVQALVDYLQGPAGQRAIESTGLWAVPPERSVVGASERATTAR